MNRLVQITLGASLFLAGALSSLGLQAAAGPGPGGMHGGPGGHGLLALGRAMDRLELNETQRQALQEARADIEERLDERRAAFDEDPQEKIQAVVDGTLQRKQVKAEIKERMQEAQDSMLFVVDRLFDVYETLDADQRAELGRLLSELAERREARRGEGPGGQPGGPGREAEGRAPARR